MKKSIAGDATKLVIVKVLATGLTMVTAMLLSRFRTLEEYGTYSQIQLVVTLISTLFMIGLPNSINYFLAKAEGKQEQKDFLSVYYSLSTILGILSGVIMLIMLPLICKYFKNDAISTFWYLLLLYPWTKIILSGIENLLIVFGKVTKLMVFKILYSIITLGVVTLAWVSGIDFKNYMLAFLLTEVIFSIWVYGLSAKEADGLRINFNKKIIQSVFKFCVPIGLASVVATISIEMDKLLIGYLYNTQDLAIYTNASKEMPVAIIASSITAVLMPELVRYLRDGKRKEAVKLWNDATVLALIAIAFIATALFVFAPDVIQLLYSAKYLPGVSVFRIYTLVLFLRVTYFGMILNSIGRTKFIFVSSIISLVLNVGLNFLCYMIFGFIGPAIATFLSILIVAVLQLKYSAQCMEMPLRNIFEWKKMGRIIIVNALLGLLFYVIKGYISIDIYTGSIIESIILGIIWMAIYFVIEKKELVSKWNGLR